MSILNVIIRLHLESTKVTFKIVLLSKPSIQLSETIMRGHVLQSKHCPGPIHGHSPSMMYFVLGRVYGTVGLVANVITATLSYGIVPMFSAATPHEPPTLGHKWELCSAPESACAAGSGWYYRSSISCVSIVRPAAAGQAITTVIARGCTASSKTVPLYLYC